MELLLYSILGVAVAAIFCVYRRYLSDRFTRIRKLRKRITLMLWAAANRSS